MSNFSSSMILYVHIFQQKYITKYNFQVVIDHVWVIVIPAINHYTSLVIHVLTVEPPLLLFCVRVIPIETPGAPKT